MGLGKKYGIFLATGVAGMLVSCSAGPGGGADSALTANSTALYSEKPQNFRLSLTDAPFDEIKEVNVNIDRAEILIEKAGKSARVQVAKDLGVINLLTLRDGVTLPLSDLSIPEGTLISQIRLILKPDGNFITKSDDSICNLKTPSQQKTGLKLLITHPILIETGHTYSIVVDFVADKSIVLQGNGGCLLKPVLKIKSATRKSIEDSNSGNNSSGSSNSQNDEDSQEEDLTGGVVDGNTSDDGSGFVEDDSGTGPVIIDAWEVPNF